MDLEIKVYVPKKDSWETVYSEVGFNFLNIEDLENIKGANFRIFKNGKLCFAMNKIQT